MGESEWPFDQPRNCAVISLVSIFKRAAPILYVTHDEDDHGWQFLGKVGARMAEAMVVALEEIVGLDDSVLAIADLPPGWHAWRESKDAPWQRGPSLP